MPGPVIFNGTAAKFLTSSIKIPGSTSGILTIQPAAATVSHTLTMPASQGGANTVLTNDGSGTLSWAAGGSSSASVGPELVDLSASITKLGGDGNFLNQDYIAQSFNNSNTLILSLSQNISAAATIIYLDQNKTQIDAMDATTGWNAGSGSAIALNNTAGQFIEGTGSVKQTCTNLNGSSEISKTYTAFTCIDKNFRPRVYLDTISNLTRLYVKLESTAGNDVTYYFPVANLVAAAFNFLQVTLDNTPDASTGTFVRGGVTKVYLGMTTSSSQTILASWDDLIVVDKWAVIDSTQSGLVIPIYNATTQELINLASEDANIPGKYTLNAAIGNAYTRAASTCQTFTGTIANQRGGFNASNAGQALSTVHFITRGLFGDSLSSKTLSLTGTFTQTKYAVTSFPSSSTLTVGSDVTAKFKSGDKIVLFKYIRNYPNWSPEYNSTLGKNFVILTLSINSTVSSGVTTITTTSSNAHGASNADWYIVRLSLNLNYFAGALTANEALTTLTPTIFIPRTQSIAVPAGVIAYWKLDEGSGNALDSVGAYPLIQNGTVPSSSGKIDGSRGSFTGANYFNWSAGGSLSTVFDSSTLMVEGWVKFTGATSYGFISKLNTADSAGWTVRCNSSGQIVFLTANGTTLTSASSYNDGAWHYIVATQIAASGANNKRLYVDNVLVSSATAAAISPMAGNDLFMGVGPSVASPLVGTMDDWVFWNVAPTTVVALEAYIASRWNNGQGMPLGTGDTFQIGGTVSSVSGPKLVIDAQLDRQDTTGDIPQIVKYGGIIQ